MQTEKVLEVLKAKAQNCWAIYKMEKNSHSEYAERMIQNMIAIEEVISLFEDESYLAKVAAIYEVQI